MYKDINNMGLTLDSTEPASQTDIELFEKELNVKLGEEYKKFLQEFGTLEVEYFEFYGTFKDNSSLPSAVYATKYTRNIIENFDNTLIVFYESGDGSYFCVDCNDEVYHCNYNRCSKLNETFKNFIQKKLEEL